jgi:hypothetical protein
VQLGENQDDILIEVVADHAWDTGVTIATLIEQ